VKESDVFFSSSSFFAVAIQAKDQMSHKLLHPTPRWHGAKAKFQEPHSFSLLTSLALYLIRVQLLLPSALPAASVGL